MHVFAIGHVSSAALLPLLPPASLEGFLLYLTPPSNCPLVLHHGIEQYCGCGWWRSQASACQWCSRTLTSSKANLQGTTRNPKPMKSSQRVEPCTYQSCALHICSACLPQQLRDGNNPEHVSPPHAWELQAPPCYLGPTWCPGSTALQARSRQPGFCSERRHTRSGHGHCLPC